MGTTSEFYLKREIAMLKLLLSEGFFWINVWSQDCDGINSERSRKFTSIGEFDEWEESFVDNCEGSQGFEIVEKDSDGSYDLLEDYTSSGGWGIN